MTDELTALYAARFGTVLVPVAKQLERLLQEQLASCKRIDRICARAKEPSRFIEKAAKVEEGRPYYTDPLEQIQDQLAARVIVFYSDDVDIICAQVLKYFKHVEQTVKEPDSHSEFGYFGKHLILSLPTDALPASVRRIDAPRLFELQVRTLFQHAWSESNHDLCYKAKVKLTREQQRRSAYAAAQAWGADKILDDLSREIFAAEAALADGRSG